MALKLYNSMGRRKMLFKPLRGRTARMYTCGPTVWNYAHIGNYRTYVFEDLLRRYLKFKGFRVVQVMNITDVEDNIIKGMKQTNKGRKELTEFYEEAFMEDISTLGIERAERYPRATDHIAEMVALVKKLMKTGYAYRAEDGSIYYRISKFRRYGKLSGIEPARLKAAGRVSADHYEDKLEANDFALWKAWDPEDGEVFWETELGKGRPGWSIECSAMSMKYLGDSFDIHTGGLDNRFPHHENEIAQSEAATGRKFVRFWLHSQFLTINGEPMHKSAGNVKYLRDLLTEGYHPMTIRLFLLYPRYRDVLDLNEAQLRQADAMRRRLNDFVSRLRSLEDGSGGEGTARKLIKRFEEAMDDDLNTPRAFASLSSVMKETNTLIDQGRIGRAEAARVVAALRKVDSVLGIIDFGSQSLPAELQSLVASREEARRAGDYETADRLRAKLLEKGIVIEDTPAGTLWKRRSSS